MEIAGDELLNLLWIALDIAAKRLVVIGTELGNDAVDHSWREDTMLLEHLALPLETVSRSHTRVGQLSQRLQPVGILSSMDIDVHISAFSQLKGIVHLKTVTTGHTKTGQQLVEIGRAIGRAHLHGLLLAGVEMTLRLERVGLTAHVDIGSPP